MYLKILINIFRLCFQFDITVDSKVCFILKKLLLLIVNTVNYVILIVSDFAKYKIHYLIKRDYMCIHPC